MALQKLSAADPRLGDLVVLRFFGGLERAAEQLGVAERVAGPRRGDEVLVVPGVADQGPARAKRLAEKIGCGGTVAVLLGSLVLYNEREGTL